MSGFEWRVEKTPVAYPDALSEMEQRVAAIEASTKPELFWLLEHPPLYTAGTSADEAELLDAHGFPVFETGRGGKMTYHGPGQRIAYVMSDLRARGRDVRAHVCRLEELVIRTLKDFGIEGERRTGRIGIWVTKDGREEKIAAIGVRVRHWVAYHGLALNVAPNLEHFNGIVPCGLPEFGVTSMEKLGVKATLGDVDKALRQNAEIIFKA